MIGRDKEKNQSEEPAAVTTIGRDRDKHRARYATTIERGKEKERSRLQAGSTTSIRVKTSTQTNQTPTQESEVHPQKPAIVQVARPTSDRKTPVPSCANSKKKRTKNVWTSIRFTGRRDCISASDEMQFAVIVARLDIGKVYMM